MARKKLLHLKSNVTQNVSGSTVPKLPTSEQIDYGEIAVNYAKGYETLAIKNSNGDVIPFTNSITMYDYIDDKLGSGFTSSSVTEVIESNERVISSSLNDLETRKLDASAYTPTDLSNYYTKSETSGATELSTAFDTINVSIEDLSGQSETVAAALNYLNDNKLDESAYTPTDLSNYYTKTEVDERDLWVSGTGLNSVVLKGSSGTASGDYAVAEGHQTSGTGVASHAEGQHTLASGDYSHSEGHYTTANGRYSHVEGINTTASGESSHAEGYSTTASGSSSHAEGLDTKASGNYSHAEGHDTKANGGSSHAEGYSTTASGDSSHAEGQYTKANGSYSHAEGYSTTASGDSSHAEGYSTKANGGYGSHAEGQNTTANGNSSHAEGLGASAMTDYSHAEGQSTKTGGYASHAEGSMTQAIGNYSHAEGERTAASGNKSHAEGNITTASGDFSHTEGQYTIAKGQSSHAEGQYTTANNQAEHASGQYNVSSSASTSFGNSGNTLFTIGNGVNPNMRHNAFEIRQNGDIYIVNKDGDDVRLQDEIGNIDVDQVLDDTTSASTNPVSSKAVYKAVTDNELVWTNAYVVISGAISSHTEDTSIHVTSDDKANWNAKLDASDIASFFDDAKYEDSGTTKVINFYHGNTIKATIDASDFIVDGMVDDVRIENGNLVIDFNTASGKQDISIPLTNIFDPSNYYNKTEIDNLVGSGFTSSSITEVIIENEEIVSNALTDLDERKLDASAYTPTDLSNYYTKSQTSGATELETAFGNKANTATTLAGYGITDAYTKSQTSGATELTTEFAKYYTTAQTSGATELSTAFDAIDDKFGSGFTVSSVTEVIESNERVISSSLNDLNTRKLDASAYTPTDLTNYYTKSETSGKTEISTALDDKVDKTEYATFSAATNTSISDLSGQSETVAAALNYLNDNKLDASAYTPTDLSDYYTKSQTSGATELTTAFSAKADKTEDLDGLKLKKITQAAYDALTVKDPNTLYVIVN